MKASEIVEGSDYLVNRARDWQACDYTGAGYYNTTRVRVWSTKVATWVTDGKGGFTETYKGSSRGTFGILGHPVDVKSGAVSDRLAVVTLASVRGLWEVLWPQVQAAAAREREARQAQRVDREGKQARTVAAVARIQGVRGSTGGIGRYDADRALVHVDVLEWIADMLEAGS